MKPHVSIKSKHIAKGIKCDSWSCPIALAFRESGFDDIVIGSTFVSSDDFKFLQDPATQQWRHHFDSGEGVYPFTLILPTGITT